MDDLDFYDDCRVRHRLVVAVRDDAMLSRRRRNKTFRNIAALAIVDRINEARLTRNMIERRSDWHRLDCASAIRMANPDQ
jgi:hypothetical protein